MPTGEHLRPPNAEQARERGRKGGIASVASRRAKKTFKEALVLLLDAKLKGQEITGREAISVALFEKAMSGDVKAFQELRDTIGEKPKDSVYVDAVVDTVATKEQRDAAVAAAMMR